MSQAGLVDIESSHPQIPTSFTTDAGTAIPIANNLEILGDTVANGLFAEPVWTTASGKTIEVNVQVGTAMGAAPADKFDAGLVSFDSGAFAVDTNGYVTLLGGGPSIDSVGVDANTAPGTDPVLPDGAGTITVTGAQVAAGTTANAIRTNSLAANQYTIEIQRSSEQVGSTIGANGICHFDASQFTVDSAGFVTLQGGGVAFDSVAVQTGTSPVVPTAAGLLTINGAVVAAGTNPVRSDGTGANTLAIEVQTSQALAATDATKIGLCNFDSSAFAVDANGFVTLAGGGLAIDSIGVDATSGGGTNPVLPTAAGLVTVNGAVIAASTTPVRSVSTAVNVYQIQVQTSQAIAAADATKIGLCNFDSASFAVAATGFVTLVGSGGFTWNDVSGAFSPLKNNGYFITGTATGTLPAVPAQGDTIKFFVDHATQVLTIDAPGTQIIRIGTLVTSAGGTAVSTLQGDSVELTYRSSDTCWCAIAGLTGTWVIA